MLRCAPPLRDPPLPAVTASLGPAGRLPFEDEPPPPVCNGYAGLDYGKCAPRRARGWQREGVSTAPLPQLCPPARPRRGARPCALRQPVAWRREYTRPFGHPRRLAPCAATHPSAAPCAAPERAAAGASRRRSGSSSYSYGLSGGGRSGPTPPEGARPARPRLSEAPAGPATPNAVFALPAVRPAASPPQSPFMPRVCCPRPSAPPLPKPVGRSRVAARCRASGRQCRTRTPPSSARP